MKNVAKFAAILSILTMTLLLSGLAFAAVPDQLICSAQPGKILADGSSTTEISAQLFTGDNQPVKMCGVEIKCETQNWDYVHPSAGGTIVSGTTDEFGKVGFTFISEGDREANIGTTQVICRSLQYGECQVAVETDNKVPKLLGIFACPWTGGLDDGLPDILADGESKVQITAQLRDIGDLPIKMSGVRVKFVSLNTNIVKECVSDADGDGWDLIVATTDNQGLAHAEFCSAGSGSENKGYATIRVEGDGGFDILTDTIRIDTVLNYGATTLNGNLLMSAKPTKILADGESLIEMCVQLRDKADKIIRNPPTSKVVSFLSKNPSIVQGLDNQDPLNPGYDEQETANPNFPQGGIYTSYYISSGDKDPENVGSVAVESSAEFMTKTSVSVETVTWGIWPTQIAVVPTLPIVGCDGEQTVTVTAQLLDNAGLPVKKAGEVVTFKSDDVSKLKNPDTLGDSSTLEETTDSMGQATATFVTTDCKYGGTIGDVHIHATIISPLDTEQATITVVKLDGHVPDGVNVYTDHTFRGKTDTDPAHASPALISTDGQKPTYVTAQICEWENVGTAGEYCNPVRRGGVLVEFDVIDDEIVRNRDDGVAGGTYDDNPDAEAQGTDFVKIRTDEEGKATAVFRSTGTDVSNEGCTNIKVEAMDGSSLGEAWARVCAHQDEGLAPNAVWVWAQPDIITANGVDSTTLRSALLWCTPTWLETVTRNQDNVVPETLLGDASVYCKPVQYAGAEVKFEVDDYRKIDDGMGGKLIKTITDQYGHADATFYSAGFQTHNIGLASVSVFVDHVGEQVTQLNELTVWAREKTWPWCDYQYDGAVGDADLDGDGFISDNELLQFIFRWITPGDLYHQDSSALFFVVTEWLHF